MLASHGTFHHVYDFTEFHLPFGIHIPLPEIMGIQLTKYMVLQLVAAGLAIIIFRGVATRAKDGHPVSGWFWNFWEMLALYIRDNVVRPVIGDPHHHEGDDHSHVGTYPTDSHGDHAEPDGVTHPADKYLPFLWSCFFFILFCNLLGAFPWFGSATANINVTGALALTAFIATFIYGAQLHGPVGFWTHMVPNIDAPGAVKVLLVPMIFAIEAGGLFIKHGVLAVRLFANIMGGHTVIAVILAFIADAATSGAWFIVTPGSLLGQIGVGLLELLVAFIQAYVFTFLSTIFIALSLHEH
ncbi:F0F1 ATP synthase subunit A [Thalassoglobus sp. JC818]|uniref:F0F1 ATP synthase subunit A n=1 Tax=Thalassoglobus sp. JC818 TaxID=3232136 RepID=UPI0034589DEE